MTVTNLEREDTRQSFGPEDDTAKSTKEPTAEQHLIASLLLELSNAAFVINPKTNSPYISLDAQVGKSKRNKNAVTVSRSHVGFMVSDWSAKAQAESLRLDVEADTDHKKLKFPHLTRSSIVSNSTFLEALLASAKHESIERQSS